MRGFVKEVNDLRGEVKDDMVVDDYREHSLLKKQITLLRGRITRATSKLKELEEVNVLLPFNVKLRQNHRQPIVIFTQEVENIQIKQRERVAYTDTGFAHQILNGMNDLE